MLMLRVRRTAAMVALGAAVVGSVAIAAPAQAATLGSVWVTQSGWQAGWNKCRQEHPRTRSIAPKGIRWENAGFDTMRPTYQWECYDTTTGRP